MALDVVYILGNGSKWENREILYSVRGVEKHLPHRKLFIIGKKPEFFNDEVIEIPFEDIFHNKARNIMAKIRRAASDRRISSYFVLMNDDYFLLKDINPATYPYYHKGTIEDSIRVNAHNADYLPHLQATDELLKKNGYRRNNFDVHYPITYNKKKIKQVCDQFEWNVQAGYIMKSMYCNILRIEGKLINDCKINHPHLYWERLTEGWDCLSIGDRSIGKPLTKFLNHIYPNPSRYER